MTGKSSKAFGGFYRFSRLNKATSLSCQGGCLSSEKTADGLELLRNSALGLVNGEVIEEDLSSASIKRAGIDTDVAGGEGSVSY
jgi:hypothetical protein